MMSERSEEPFYHMLAETLGYTVKDLLLSLDSSEITRWQAYFKVKNYKEKQELQKQQARMKSRRRL